MKERRVKIKNKLGLHARAASVFVQLSNKFNSKITVQKDGMEVDGKSIMGLLTLAAPKGSEILIIAEGPDEEKAIESLVKLIENKFGEE